MRQKHFTQSEIGGRSENQDFFSFKTTPFGELYVICDGMGGHNGGRYAAELAAKTIINEVVNGLFNNPLESLKTAIEKANAVIWQESCSKEEFKGMGTTVVVLLLTKKKGICCHIGDSRLYHLRKGKILFRTWDHSFVFELVRNGILTEEEARLSDKSNIITRALGISQYVEVEFTDNLEFKSGDRFLLCTDGIWSLIPETQLVETVCQYYNIKTVIYNLTKKIIVSGFSNGGNHDNYTATLIEIGTINILQKLYNKIKFWLLRPKFSN